MGKWLQGTLPGEPVSSATREALRARLRTVAYYLPLAAHKSDRDVEYVHQLRVATRRAVALLRIFRPLLADKDAERLDRQLKKIRRAAGEARDLDVLGRRIGDWVEQRRTAAREALLARVEHYRDRAQAPVRKVRTKMRRKRFADRIDKIVKRVHWRAPGQEPSFAAAAAGCLRTVAEPFFTAAAGDTADLVALHRFRITAKHLRYSMEVFAAAFDADFRTSLYPIVEDVQTRLGEIHDHAAALERFQGWLLAWEKEPETEALRELADIEKAALATTRQNFIRWWTPERADDLRQRFDQALAIQAAHPGEKYA
ncbi:MAG TPA: CHAD domain-containing protein [Pirellulales bacterium]|jgi:CHAD domain-containing protein